MQIKTEIENEAALREFEALCGLDKLTPEQQADSEELLQAILTFEERYQIPDVSDADLIKHLLDQRDLTPADLTQEQANRWVDLLNDEILNRRLPQQ